MNIVAERRHQGSFRSLTCYKLVRMSTDPQPFYLNRGPSGWQDYRSPRPTLSIAPTWLKSRESSDEAKEKSTQVCEERSRARLFRKHIFSVFQRLHKAPYAEPTIAVLHDSGRQGSIASVGGPDAVKR